MIFLLPCYNEENSIKNVLKNIEEHFPSSTVIIVDDGSTDKTFERIKEIELKLNLKITILRHRKNKGLGKAISTGLNYIIKNFQDEFLTILDADETHPIELVKKMEEKMKNKNLDVVIASRYIKGGRQINLSFLRKFLSKLFSSFFHIFYPEVTDFSSGFRTYSINFLKKNFWEFKLDKGFASSFELLIKILKKNARIGEIPLFLDYSKKSSKTKFNFKKVAISYINVLFKVFL